VIGESKNQIANDEHKGRTALRDAFVVFLVVLVTELIKIGYPPTIDVVYPAFLAGLLMGIISYMTAMGIKKPEQNSTHSSV
jgi:hypothetical protein